MGRGRRAERHRPCPDHSRWLAFSGCVLGTLRPFALHPGTLAACGSAPTLLTLTQ